MIQREHSKDCVFHASHISHDHVRHISCTKSPKVAPEFSYISVFRIPASDLQLRFLKRFFYLKWDLHWDLHWVKFGFSFLDRCLIHYEVYLCLTLRKSSSNLLRSTIWYSYIIWKKKKLKWRRANLPVRVVADGVVGVLSTDFSMKKRKKYFKLFEIDFSPCCCCCQISTGILAASVVAVVITGLWTLSRARTESMPVVQT